MTSSESVARSSWGRRMRVVVIVVIVAAVLALTGWLVWPSSPGPLVLHSGTADHIVTVTVANHRMGDTGIDVALTDRSGKPVSRAVIRVQAIEPRMGYSDQPVTAAPTGSGRYHAPDVSFMMTGPWSLQVWIAMGQAIDQLSIPLWIGG
ncbi:FixH family protein [Nocardia alni]|uniref:FixH family protein n=1 Tax=Nocardia alni TaxID=2815723 RepID=UPI001C22B58E|nr:FixH family protein [Nocardia alni]